MSFDELKEKLKIYLSRVKKFKKRTIYCVALGVIFSLLSYFSNKQSIYINKNEIKRSEYGAGKSSYKIKVDVDNLADNVDFNISVSPKRYTKAEADQMFKEKFDELKINMLNGNEDYEHISNKLLFSPTLGDGIRANYSYYPKIDIGTISEAEEFDYYVKYQNLIDGSGNVNNDRFTKNETCTGYIEIQFSTEIKDLDGSYKSNKYLLPVKVISKKLSTLESFKNTFLKEIQKSDDKTINKDTIILPTIVNGYRVKYKEKIDMTFLLLPFLGILMAILLEAKDKEKIRDAIKKRKRTLEIDYSQIVTKVLLYVSSGMTIRNSMIKLAENYQNGKQVSRAAYDELVILKNKLSSGVNEFTGYEEMAKNINMRCYTRFLNIVMQSIKNGNKELKNILNMEVQDAMYERKQIAKKMGEEASTKLVLPLMMMLAIIMLVIMVPAFMGM